MSPEDLGQGRHAMVVHAYYPLGETRVQREAAALVESGMEVEVFALRGRGEPRRETVDGVEVRRLPVRRNRRLGIAFQLLEYMAFFLAAGAALTVRHLRRRYDSVQVHNLPDFLVFAALVPKLTGARVLLDLHDLMPEFFAARIGRSLRHPLVRLVVWQERLACAFADVVITVTDGWRERLVGRAVPADKVRVVMNVADPSLFQRRMDQPAHDGFNVLYHGTFSYRYGVDLLVEAAALLAERVGGLKVWLLGDGEYRPELERAVAERGLESVVEMSPGMLGVTELQPYLAAADAGVVPNRSTVFTDDLLPTKLLEYVAVGIPVVAARTPMVDACFDDDMVQFFNPGDAADLAEKLSALAASPEARRKLAESADRFTGENSWERVSRDYVALVRGQS
ncbi:MAG: glycosyltransferase family 4 protein [Actinomycetota bacterium]